jgi:hypothetical protein
LIRRKIVGLAIIIATVAKVKRIARKSKIGCLATAGFISTKAAPQAAATKTIAITAHDDFFTGSVYLRRARC